MLGIAIANDWVEQIEEVKLEVKNHFEARFLESDYRRPTLSGVMFNQMSSEERWSLEAHLSLDELKKVKLVL